MAFNQGNIVLDWWTHKYIFRQLLIVYISSVNFTQLQLCINYQWINNEINKLRLVNFADLDAMLLQTKVEWIKSSNTERSPTSNLVDI